MVDVPICPFPVLRGPLPSPCHRVALASAKVWWWQSMPGFVVGGRGSMGKGGKVQDFGDPLLTTHKKFKRRVTPADENQT